MDETVITPAASAADDPERERRIVEFLRGDRGVRLPAGFRSAVERAIAAEPTPLGPKTQARRPTWMLAGLVAMNLLLVAALLVIPRLGLPEPDPAPDSIQELNDLVQLQGRLIEQQITVITHLKTVREHDVLGHEVAMQILQRDMLDKQVTEIGALHASFETTIGALQERTTQLLADLTETETKHVDVLQRLVTAEGTIRRLEERLASSPNSDQVEMGIASLDLQREREEAAGAARLAALDREIRAHGGDPGAPPASIEPVVGRERGAPWGVPSAKVVEAGGDRALLDAGRADGLAASVRFLAYREGFGGALAYRGQLEVIRTLEGTSEARRISTGDAGALEPGLLLYNPFWRRPGERALSLRVAIAGPTPALDRVRARFEKALSDLGVTLEARCDERTELVLVERDYAGDPGFRLAVDLRLPILHVARLGDYLALPPLELDSPMVPTAASLALERARLAELLAVELAESSRLRGTLEGLGPRMKVLSQGSRELASTRARLRSEIARREAHLAHLEANPPSRDTPPSRDDQQGLLDANRPDGRVLCEDVQPMTVRIDRGREHRLAAGLVFEAYRPLRGEKREARARLVVTSKIEAREAIARVLGRYHEGVYHPLPDEAALRGLPSRVRTSFEADPLRDELIANALYDPDRPRVVVLLGQLRGRWGNPEVGRLLAELGDRVVEQVDERVDFAIAGLGHESDPRYAEVKRLGIRRVSPEELYRWLGGD